MQLLVVPSYLGASTHSLFGVKITLDNRILNPLMEAVV